MVLPGSMGTGERSAALQIDVASDSVWVLPISEI